MVELVIICSFLMYTVGGGATLTNICHKKAYAITSRNTINMTDDEFHIPRYSNSFRTRPSRCLE